MAQLVSLLLAISAVIASIVIVATHNSDSPKNTLSKTGGTAYVDSKKLKPQTGGATYQAGNGGTAALVPVIASTPNSGHAVMPKPSLSIGPSGGTAIVTPPKPKPVTNTTGGTPAPAEPAPVPPAPSPAPAPPASVLYAGQFLTHNQYLRSSNGKYTLIMQPDGNVVLYSPYRAIWSTQTSGTTGSTFAMQSDGNLVLYNASWQPIYQTGSQGYGGAYLVVQDDGNVVLYAANGTPLLASLTAGVE